MHAAGLRRGLLGGLDADGDAGIGLVGLYDAGFGDRDGQVGGSGDTAVVGGAQGARGSFGCGVEALRNGGSAIGFGLHDQLSGCAVLCNAVDELSFPLPNNQI